MKFKQMEVYFMDNEPEGIRAAWFPTGVFKTFIVPRSKIKAAKQLDDVNKPGIYFLIGDNVDGEKTVIYCGQTTQGVSRLDDHVAKKDFWNKAILFLADQHLFNRDVISGLEALGISIAKDCGRYNVDNDKVPSYNIDIYHQDTVESYFKDIKFFMNWLGYGLEKDVGADNNSILRTKRRGIVAYGIYSGEKFDVLARSMINIAKEPNIRSYKILRKELLAAGIIAKDKEGCYRLKENRTFKTPSGASDFVLGGSTNGWTEWRDKNGKTLDEISR